MQLSGQHGRRPFARFQFLLYPLRITSVQVEFHCHFQAITCYPAYKFISRLSCNMYHYDTYYKFYNKEFEYRRTRRFQLIRSTMCRAEDWFIVAGDSVLGRTSTFNNRNKSPLSSLSTLVMYIFPHEFWSSTHSRYEQYLAISSNWLMTEALRTK